MLGTFLAFSMILTLILVPASAMNSETINGEQEVVVLTLGNKEIQYSLYEVNGVRYAMYQEDGKNHIVTYDPSSNILMYDNKVIHTALRMSPNSELNASDHQMVSADSGRWVHYGKDLEVDIDISGMTTSAAVAAILLACGTVANPMAATIIGAAITELLLDNLSDVVAVSVKIVSYYWDPVTTQRPKIKRDFYLYSGTDCKPENFLCQF